MKLWTLEYNDENKYNFPQLIYKGVEVNSHIEVKLIKELFRLFYVTHIDEKAKIKELEQNNNLSPYKELYELILPPKNVEFQKEYLVDLLNFFSIEIENLE